MTTLKYSGVPDDTTFEQLLSFDVFNIVFEAWKSKPDYSTSVFKFFQDCNYTLNTCCQDFMHCAVDWKNIFKWFSLFFASFAGCKTYTVLQTWFLFICGVLYAGWA